MRWPAEHLASAGHDVTSVLPADRHFRMDIDRTGRVHRVYLPPGTDVVVLQRVTHPFLASAIPAMRAQGVAVVVDIDDDLSCIHPENPAFISLHPKSVGVMQDNGVRNQHSWRHLQTACRDATLVTVSTAALLDRYGYGHGRLLPNRLPDAYYGLCRADSDVIGWPAALQTHPDDPTAVGPAVARLVAAGATFRVVGFPAGVGRAFGMPDWRGDETCRPVPLEEYPAAVARIGIGIAPLADTRFNAAKSALKILEMSACGVPWVASPRVEYRKLHTEGAGLLADRPKDWYRLLRDLRNNPARRAELSEAGRAVAENHRLRDHAWRWLEAWADALRLERQHRTPLGQHRPTPAVVT